MPRKTRKENFDPRSRRKKRWSDFDNGKVCPHPEKHKYATKAEAEVYINHLYSHRLREYSHHYLPERAYLCPCDSWHVTSKEKFHD